MKEVKRKSNEYIEATRVALRNMYDLFNGLCYAGSASFCVWYALERSHNKYLTTALLVVGVNTAFLALWLLGKHFAQMKVTK